MMGDMTDLIMMSAPDGYWEDQEPNSDFIQLPKQCAYCGRKGLYWAQHNGSWRLTTRNGRIHSCIAYREATKP